MLSARIEKQGRYTLEINYLKSLTMVTQTYKSPIQSSEGSYKTQILRLLSGNKYSLGSRSWRNEHHVWHSVSLLYFPSLLKIDLPKWPSKTLKPPKIKSAKIIKFLVKRLVILSSRVTRTSTTTLAPLPKDSTPWYKAKMLQSMMRNCHFSLRNLPCTCTRTCNGRTCTKLKQKSEC